MQIKLFAVSLTGEFQNMKTIKNYLLLLLAFFAFRILPANVFAGDYANLNFIGFSKDGKYLAFEEYGVTGRFGFSVFELLILSKSKKIPTPRRPLENRSKNRSMKTLCRRKRDSCRGKKSRRREFEKIQNRSGNTGEMVVARLLTDLNVGKIEPDNESNNQIVKFTDYRDSSYYEKEYALLLKTSEIKTKHCEYSSDPVLKLDLTLKDTKTETEKILQKDETVPESRNCPLAYSIQNVYVYENRIAVFINVFTMGFEGPDMRFMAVTGVYK